MSEANGAPASGPGVSAVRDEWVEAVNELVSRVEEWCKELDWATRRASKPVADDGETGPYDLPMLLMQRWEAKLLLTPVSREVVGGGGRVDLYSVPEYDDVAVLLHEDGTWRIWLRLGPDEQPRPLTRDTFQEVIEAFSGGPDGPLRPAEQRCFIRGDQVVLVAPDGEYPIDLNRCDEAGKILGWVTRLADKVWVTSPLLKQFVRLAADRNGVPIDSDA